MACARIVPPNVSYDEFSSLGRIVNKATYRKMGIGKELVKRGILECEKRYPNFGIRISGQLYLRKFYESFDFVKTSEIYIEDNIDHIQLTKYHVK